MTHPADLTPIAVAPTSDGRPAVRVLYVDAAGNERVLDRSEQILYAPMPPGTHHRHGYWHPLSADEQLALAADVDLSDVADASVASEPRWDLPPVIVDALTVSSSTFTRSIHPQRLDEDKTALSVVFEELRNTADGFPLRLAVHVRGCDDPVPFLTTAQAEGLIDTDDVVLIITADGAKDARPPEGIRYSLVDETDPVSWDFYHGGELDLVLLTGDEPLAKLPADRFDGRASVAIVEVVGPQSAELIEWFRPTDALVFLSYPWPAKSAAAGTLWQCFASDRDIEALRDCVTNMMWQVDNGAQPREHLRNVAAAVATALRADELALDALVAMLQREVDGENLALVLHTVDALR
jgi:hypothetical protein